MKNLCWSLTLNSALKQSAYQLLARREQSAKELTTKLLNKGYDVTDVAELLEKLQASDLQSDERFADALLRSRTNKGYGWLYIAQELKQKGISARIINELAKNQEIDWYLQAEIAYNRRFGNTEISSVKEKAKRVRFLQYRGFDLDQALTAIHADNEQI